MKDAFAGNQQRWTRPQLESLLTALEAFAVRLGEAAVAARRDFGRTVLMAVTDEASEEVQQFQRAGVVTITVGPHEDWAPAWLQGVQSVWSTV